MVKKKPDKREEYVTNKILAVFVLAFVLILGLLMIYNGYRSFETMLMTQRIVYGISIAGVVAAISGIVWESRSIKAGSVLAYRIFRGANLSLVGLFVAFCTFISAYYFVDGVRAMYVFVPVAAALALIYMIYSTEFFAVAAATTLGGLLMWLLSRAYLVAFAPERLFSSKLSIGAMVYCLLLLVAMILLVPIRKNGGEYSLGKKKIRIFSKTASYILIALSFALTAVCLLLALVFGSSVAYYLIFVLFGYLFVLAVYYTVKLI